MRALEALADGDPMLAARILESVADDLGERLTPPRVRRRRHCAVCALGPLFPGELEQHVRRVHGERSE
jgi:hypothetical protein